MKLLQRIYRFIKFNKQKILTIECFWYSAFYFLQVFHGSISKQKAHWGVEGEESETDVTFDEYHYAMRVAYTVNRVCNKTRWESKCLVRALTAQKLLSNKKIASTLYLGCGLDEDGKMMAHAWLRCGAVFVTGGNHDDFVVVDKFRSGK